MAARESQTMNTLFLNYNKLNRLLRPRTDNEKAEIWTRTEEAEWIVLVYSYSSSTQK